MRDYGNKGDRQNQTFIEWLLPPLITYIVRKTVLYLIRGNMYAIKFVADRFRFSTTMEVTDREVWNWNVWKSIPRYKAKLERKK